MKPAEFAALLSVLRVADAHLALAHDEAEPGPVPTHIAAARAHLDAMERRLVTMRDGATAPRPATIVDFPPPRRLPAGMAIAAVGPA